MASPNTTFTEIVTTTHRNHPTMMADNVSDHNALYRRLTKKGKVRKVNGGYEIVRPLDYAENQTYQRYSGYDVLNISASDVLSAAKYDWVQAAIHVTASGRELRMNSGSEQIRDLVKDRMMNAVRTAANNMSVDIYSDGALSNQIGGLSHMITSDGTGTVGGINSSTWAFWANQFYEHTGTPGPTNMREAMNRLWLLCTRGTDSPDLIVSTHDFYAFYWDQLQALQRYTGDADTGRAGFPTLKFLNADVIFDSNTNFTTTSETMYFLNTDYLELVVHPAANWTLAEEKISTNQDAVVHPYLFQGQLCCSNRSLQGKLKDES